ncbi:hypothetical protein DQ04_02391040 [Trypanosoma grayi]|uniref:hypothetical protein n=1 Tax=Trypanosoma grayi TaxID=71804 RepID=UPI0004F45A7F|nr:hypothetical protein DQ04_02391040 [Trypanosoma grayi]KEG11658.1 hypothetical protein DQ04_02391040 [Trypanosoma grayi]
MLYAAVILMWGAFQLFIVLRRGGRMENSVGPHLDPRDTFVTSALLPEDFRVWRRISSSNEMRTESFYRLRSAVGGRWLGHFSNGVYHDVSERTVGVLRGRTKDTYAIQAWSTMFLSAHSDGRVGMDRAAARSAEMWRFDFVSASGTVALWSASERRYVRVSGDRLKCDVKELGAAAQWEIYVEPRVACRSPAVGEAWNFVARDCWGLVRSPQNEPAGMIVLFGTPKPLKSLAPNTSDKHDPFVIVNRTLFNWALIDGVQPVVLTDDPLSHKLIEQINQENAAKGVGHHIDVIKEFECHEKFGQPTYRGLFLSVLLAYPDAQAFMYSNMDILFSRSSVATIHAIRRYKDAVAHRLPSVKGWFAVGRRINVDIPLNWSLNSDWEEDVEVSFRAEGVPFQSLSEDYFAMNNDMFDWRKAPDFVVGGTAFDNWLTTQAVLRAREGLALTLEASHTLTAIHQNHGENAKASHRHPKSRYNNVLAHRNGGWSLGRTTDAPLMTVRHFGDEILVFDKLGILLG